MLNFILNSLKKYKIKKEQEARFASIWQILRTQQIPYWKFIWFYLNLVRAGLLNFAYAYFRYFLMIIFRRTFIVWTSLVTYAYVSLKDFSDFLVCLISKIHEILMFPIGYKIILVVFLVIFLRIFYPFLKGLYRYFFQYPDLLNFNKKLASFYEENILSFLKRQKNQVKQTPDIKEEEKEKTVIKKECKTNNRNISLPPAQINKKNKKTQK